MLALDLVNTRDATGDHLATPEGLAAWLAGHGIEAPAGRAVRQAVHEVRAAVTEVVRALRAGEAPPQDARAALTVRRELAWDGERLTERPAPAGPGPAARVRAQLAAAAIDLLVGLDPATVHECGAPDCTRLFVPAHPRRRWCSDACGNRVRVTRYYHRHKGGGP
ncbi:CGNR zinc finger domain-containing protein [Dactylosporangium sp. NPDC005572]|uniref:CGNR zinc finger domain-containing protein n=1 Tax=Dactylosporangium sp. NPDC005572 TaxID=3156889 RepID=UPI0033A0A7EC